ncbi:MAG: efflux RND transporter periplasmic adaptor subunit [Planctomycetaceae bacterium]|nr:efflux RND transporter periplasmic adaptor subunit [Planctomycetales bacterium]MCB9925981.1 efflux RND transporter periplasmic adaptor subunit [Planctomycetaceae bacterium]
MNQQLTLSIVIAALWCSSGCIKIEKPVPAKIEPAHVEHHVDEQNLNRVTLTERAEERLGIKLVATKLIEIRRRRTVGGEVMLPPGQTITVSAPLAGTLSRPSTGDVPVAGSRIEAGRAMFTFKPLLTPERDVLTSAEQVGIAQTRVNISTVQIEAERQIESAKIGVEAAQIAYDRAVQLLKNKAGSQRNVDEASAVLRLAQEALTTAETRHAFLSGITLDEQAGELVSREIVSPVTGVLQSLEAAAGETVVSGKLLFSVITTNRVWIRVPVYVGQWRGIDTAEAATIAEFGQPLTANPRTATYVSAPPSANPLATSVDVFYQLDNTDGDLYPGQRLAVTLPLHNRTQSLVVPFRAVLYDIHGGAWVYEQIDEHVYARRRVSVDYVDGEEAILETGPDPGTKVVTDGAVELFGTEFEVGH